MAPRPAATVNGSPWIPLRDDYFETPLLSQKESAYLVRKACEAAQEVVERARSTGGPIQWRHVEKLNDVQLYAGFARATHSNEPSAMCGVTSVPGSLREIASLFEVSTTRAMKDFARAHRDLFFDAVVLHTLSPRTREHPLHQVTAKWIATRSPKGLDDRDFCYLECQDKFTDSTGRKGWVLCLHSIKLPGCDDLSREFGFVRGSFYHSGIVVVEADRPGFVDIIHILQMNLKGNAKMSSTYLRDRVAWIGQIKSILREKRLNEQRYLSDLELVPKKYRSRCHVCQDSFSLLLLRKMNCRKCGEVVCGACSKDFDVTNAKFLETVKLRICMHCYQLITAGQMLGTILDEPRASTALSLLGYFDDTQRASIITEIAPSGHHRATGLDNGRGGQQNNRPTKIILHSLAQQRAQQRGGGGRRPVARGGSQHPPQSQGHYSMGGGGPPPDGRRMRPSNGTMNGYGYEPAQDSRSLFDKPRHTASRQTQGGAYNNNNGSFDMAYAAAPPSPATLFDRDRQPSRAKRDERTSGSGGGGGGGDTAPKPRVSQPRESRGQFKIPQSLYDQSADQPSALSPQRPRGDSNSSASSTGSIDIDSFEIGKAIAAPAHPDATIKEELAYPNAPPRYGVSHDNADDEDTEGSVGSGDDEPDYKHHPPAPKPRRMAPTYYEDEEEEEKKTDEFGATPALSAPSPSAYTGMQHALLASARSDASLNDVPFQRRNFNISDLSVNTADCDTSFLDTQMRQFHGQPFYMRGANSTTTTDSNDPRATIDFSVASSPREGSISSEDQAAAAGAAVPHDVGSSPASPPPPPSLPPPPLVTSPQSMMTSPQKTLDGIVRPPLYSRPTKKTEPSVVRATTGEAQPAQAPMQRETTASISSSISSGDAAVVRQTLELGNKSFLSVAPSTHSHEDLTFHAEQQTRAVAGSTNAAPKASEPPVAETRTSESGRLPSYVPARFQTTRLQPVKEPISQEDAIQQLQQKRLSDELLRSDDEKIEKLIGRDTFSHVLNVRSSATSDGKDQDDIEDVDFEELLRMSKLNQEENEEHAKKIQPLAVALERSDTQETDLGEFYDGSDSESDDGDLLSARRIYSKFNSSKRLETVAGVRESESFQRTFDEIKEHINLLSDSEDDDDATVKPIKAKEQIHMLSDSADDSDSGDETANWSDEVDHH